MPVLAALLALGFLWSLGSLRADLLPYAWQGAGTDSLTSQALRLAVLAFGAAVIARATRSRRVRRRDAVQWALTGIGLIAAPSLLAHLAAPFVADLTRTALFALTPIFAIVLEPYLGSAESGMSRNGLLAALVALAGMLLLFPVNLPQSPASALAFLAVVLAALCVAAVNCRAVCFACAQDAPSFAAAAALAAAGAALVLGVAGAGEAAPFPAASLLPDLAWTLIVDLPALLLLFALMRRMTAARMTLRFIRAALRRQLQPHSVASAGHSARMRRPGAHGLRSRMDVAHPRHRLVSRRRISPPRLIRGLIPTKSIDPCRFERF
ncbi:MAG TPA: hypothetical protein VG893_03880 [Terracidiphilus sp.]|nr:hypothetical protein [Terracidiphilus sp.]